MISQNDNCNFSNPVLCIQRLQVTGLKRYNCELDLIWATRDLFIQFFPARIRYTWRNQVQKKKIKIIENYAHNSNIKWNRNRLHLPQYFCIYANHIQICEKIRKKSKMAIKQKIKKGSLRMEIEHFAMTYKWTAVVGGNGKHKFNMHPSII